MEIDQRLERAVEAWRNSKSLVQADTDTDKVYTHSGNTSVKMSCTENLTKKKFKCSLSSAFFTFGAKFLAFGDILYRLCILDGSVTSFGISSS